MLFVAGACVFDCGGLVAFVAVPSLGGGGV